MLYHSLVFFRTVGVESGKVLKVTSKNDCMFFFLKISNQFSDFRSILYLRGWSGQLDCTGVGTAELGLISMAL